MTSPNAAPPTKPEGSRPAGASSPAGDPTLGDAQASADKVLAPSEDAGGHGGGEAEAAAPVDPVFSELTDYVQVGGYAKGGENFWIPGGGLKSESYEGNRGSNVVTKLFERVKRGPFHAPHYAVIQVAPVLEVKVAEGEAPPKPHPIPTSR